MVFFSKSNSKKFLYVICLITFIFHSSNSIFISKSFAENRQSADSNPQNTNTQNTKNTQIQQNNQNSPNTLNQQNNQNSPNTLNQQNSQNNQSSQNDQNLPNSQNSQVNGISNSTGEVPIKAKDESNSIKSSKAPKENEDEVIIGVPNSKIMESQNSFQRIMSKIPLYRALANMINKLMKMIESYIPQSVSNVSKPSNEDLQNPSNNILNEKPENSVFSEPTNPSNLGTGSNTNQDMDFPNGGSSITAGSDTGSQPLDLSGINPDENGPLIRDNIPTKRTSVGMGDNELKLYTNGRFDFLFDPNIDPRLKYLETKKMKNNVALAKKIIRNRVDKWWPVLVKYLPFKTREDAYAFFMGVTALESTFDLSCVTGGGHTGYTERFMQDQSDCAHAIGLMQVAETGFRIPSNSFGWKNESNVSEIPQAPLTAQYYYDPIVNVDMAIRKMCHFGVEACKTLGLNPVDAARRESFWALVLKGHNTGHATFEKGRTFNRDWWNFYAKTVGTAGEYLKNEGHLADGVKTFHTDPHLKKYEKGGHYLRWLT